MRKVIDSNYLQLDELNAYLSRSNGNYAVLTDYAAMEAYKGDTLSSIYKSMAILAKFPEQVIVLKNTGTICGLTGRGAGLQRRLIDRKQTNGFKVFCQRLIEAQHGNEAFVAQILSNGRYANAHMNRILVDARTIAQSAEKISKTYTKSELRVLRTNGHITNSIAEKFVTNVINLASDLFSDHPSIRHWPNAVTLHNTYIFRCSLSMYLLLLDWIENGGQNNASAATIRNDMIDASFATYATYFDGLLSHDRKALRVYEMAIPHLRVLASIQRAGK